MNFGPAPFKSSTGHFWAYFSPIQQDIQNGNLDVSGFKFAPDPAINITSSDYPSVLTTFQQTTSTKLTFLGIPLASGNSETVSITLPSCPGHNPGQIPIAFSSQPPEPA